ncbi:hypothetical protein KR222_011877 [Zaprionus bogoriensis]|nr:hypothetical protein KR222_011877 [Zaprionus bogoriensis]
MEILRKIIKRPPIYACEKIRGSYVEIFQAWLDLVNINNVGEDGISLINYAGRYQNEMALKILFQSGAYIGMRSDYKELPIANIRSDVLEELLDSCIEKREGRSRRDFYIHLSMKNISHRPKEKSDKFVDNDITNIAYFKNSQKLNHLLKHPVIMCLLAHKWHIYSKFFFVHFFIYMLFLIFISTHIMSRFPSRVLSNSIVVQYFCWIFIGYLLIREVVQFFLDWLQYLRSAFVNFLDLSVIILAILTCLEYGDQNTQSVIATYTWLLATFKFLHLASSLRIKWISLPILMLLLVIGTVVKYLCVLFSLVLIFCVSFYIRFGTPQDLRETNTTSDPFEFGFNNFISSVIKLSIMSTGEYDAGNLHFRSYFDFLLILIFVLVVGISLFNLLTALAVSDIQVSFEYILLPDTLRLLMIPAGN